MKVKEILTESLSRIWQHVNEHDYGTVTAFRYARDCNKGEPYTRRENLQRNASLLAKLRAKGYGVTAIDGGYIEGHTTELAREVLENSFLVVDRQNRGDLLDTLKQLGEEFEQDSILFGTAGKAPSLYGTSNCPNNWPAYGQPHEFDPFKWKGYDYERDEEGNVKYDEKGLPIKKDVQFFSKKGNKKFYAPEKKVEQFKECITVIESYGVCKYPTELRGQVILANKHWSEL